VTDPPFLSLLWRDEISVTIELHPISVNDDDDSSAFQMTTTLSKTAYLNLRTLLILIVVIISSCDSLLLFADAFHHPAKTAHKLWMLPINRVPATTRKFTQQQKVTVQLNLSSSFSPIPFILASVVGGAAPTPFVTKAIQIWYKRISLPTYTPPDRLFAPVWTFLYATIGYSFWRILSTTTLYKFRRILAIWLALHYLMNLSWAPLFFGCKNLKMGHVVNVLLIITLYTLLPLLYTHVDMLTAVILIPYALWLAFATQLSHDICRLNPTDSSGYNNAKLQDDIYKLRREAGRKVGL
jgi:tryptophan-rich sensory protein